MESTAITEVRGLLPHLWKSTLLSGLLAVIIGVLMLVWPGKTLVVAAILFGSYLLISGIAQVFFAFTLHVSAGGRVLLFISGAASLILAVLAFRHFGEGYAFTLLAIWIGVGFIFRGVATAVSALFASFCSWLSRSFLSSGMMYVGSKPFSTSTLRSRSGRSRTWP